MDNAPPKAGGALVCGRIGLIGASDPGQFLPGRVSLLRLRQVRLRLGLREAVGTRHGFPRGGQFAVQGPEDADHGLREPGNRVALLLGCGHFNHLVCAGRRYRRAAPEVWD